MPYGGVGVVLEERASGLQWAALLTSKLFLRDETRDAQAWQELLERQRAGREGYYAAVRQDLALPPGHPARRPLPSADGQR